MLLPIIAKKKDTYTIVLPYMKYIANYLNDNLCVNNVDMNDNYKRTHMDLDLLL